MDAEPKELPPAGYGWFIPFPAATKDIYMSARKVIAGQGGGAQPIHHHPYGSPCNEKCEVFRDA